MDFTWGKPLVKACSDLLAAHPRKCVCSLAGMAIWRFSSWRKVMKSLCMGTVHNPLQSVHGQIPLCYGKDVRQSFVSNSLLDVVPFNELIFGLDL
jgi:hypothetical protein